MVTDLSPFTGRVLRTAAVMSAGDKEIYGAALIAAALMQLAETLDFPRDVSTEIRTPEARPVDAQRLADIVSDFQPPEASAYEDQSGDRSDER